MDALNLISGQGLALVRSAAVAFGLTVALMVPAGVAAAVAPSPRGRIQGVVTLQRPDGTLFVQDEQRGYRVQAINAPSVEVGDRVDAEGTFGPASEGPSLVGAEVWRLTRSVPPAPLRLRVDQILERLGQRQSPEGCLVQLEGRLTGTSHDLSGLVAHLEAPGGTPFHARIHAEPAALPQAALRRGSQWRLTGVCFVERGELGQARNLWLLLRTANNLEVLTPAPWWSVPGLQWALGLVVALLLLALAWRRTVERQVQARIREARTQLATQVARHRQFELLLENIPGPVYLKDAEGRYLYANRAWEKQFPNPRTDWLGKTDAAFWPESAARLRAETDRSAFESQSTTVRVESGTDGAGRLKHWISYQFAIQDADHRKVLGGILLDITARQEAEEALRQSKDLLAKAFDASPEAIAISSETDDTLLDANPSFARLTGIPREQLIGQTWKQLGVWEQDSLRQSLAQRVRGGQSIQDTECRFRSRTGALHITSACLKTIELNNEPCLLWILRDQTDHLLLEAQLRQAQKMESVGQLAAGVAHDFNNILTVIQGYVSLLEALQDEHSPAAEPLRQIATAAERAANLTRQLLTFSRRQILQPQVIELNDVIRNLSKMLQRMLGEDIALECQLGAQPAPLHADPGMLEQILMNLAVNSRDAMPRGGQLLIRTELLDLTAAQASRNPEARAGRFVCLTVLDTGCGMDHTTLARVFEPFFTTKEIGKGTGLGLATVYGIVKQHRGWVEVESEVGRGTVFRIFFPPHHASPRPESPPAQHAPSPLGQGHGTILMVEDEPALRSLARRILVRSGYTVLEAESGREALEVWRRSGAQIDLLLTDMVMPEGVSGRELAQQLLRDKPQLKVIFTSGYSLETIDQGAPLLGGSHFLPKPYASASLTQAVADALGAPAKDLSPDSLDLV